MGDPIIPITYLVDLAATGLDVVGLAPGLDFDIETTQAGIVVSITGTTDEDVHYVITTDGSLLPCTEKIAEGWITVNLKPELVMCAKDTIITTSLGGTGDRVALLALKQELISMHGKAGPGKHLYVEGETSTGTGTWTGTLEFEKGTTDVTLYADQLRDSNLHIHRGGNR